MNNWRSGERDQAWSWNKDFPFQSAAKRCHQAMSRRASSSIGIRADMEEAVVLRSMRRRMNVRPGGTTLAAKDSVPMRDRSSRLEQSVHWSQVARAVWRVDNLSRGEPSRLLHTVNFDPQHSHHSRWRDDLVLAGSHWNAQVLEHG